MNKMTLQGDWNIVMGKLQQKWGLLIHNDHQLSKGKEHELVGRIQKRTGEFQDGYAPPESHCNSCDSCDTREPSQPTQGPNPPASHSRS